MPINSSIGSEREMDEASKKADKLGSADLSGLLSRAIFCDQHHYIHLYADPTVPSSNHPSHAFAQRIPDHRINSGKSDFETGDPPGPVRESWSHTALGLDVRWNPEMKIR
nr:hypothetical protein CFP56_68110 [Quercus suber]